MAKGRTRRRARGPARGHAATRWLATPVGARCPGGDGGAQGGPPQGQAVGHGGLAGPRLQGWPLAGGPTRRCACAAHAQSARATLWHARARGARRAGNDCWRLGPPMTLPWPTKSHSTGRPRTLLGLDASGQKVLRLLPELPRHMAVCYARYPSSGSTSSPAPSTVLQLVVQTNTVARLLGLGLSMLI